MRGNTIQAKVSSSDSGLNNVILNIGQRFRSKLFSGKVDRRYFVAAPAFKGYLFIAAVMIIFAFLIYTQGVIKELERDAKATARTHANLIAITASEEEAAFAAVLNIIENANFPLIATYPDGSIESWNNVPGIKYPLADTTQAYREAVYRFLMEMVEEMDEENPPITFQVREIPGKVLQIHYGHPPLVRQLAWVPFLEIGAIFLFIFIGFLGFRNIKNSEQRYILVGMAKETAHQLGTPLSSLFGWIELMRSELDDWVERERGQSVRGFNRIIDEMESDMKRLRKVVSRFSQIGSVPELKRESVTDVISDTAAYFRNRMPQLGRRIEIVERYEQVPEILLNRELLGWAFENLFRNSLDAIDRPDGRIEIGARMRPDGESVEISFRDNGRGISHQDRRKAFLPGYTTKKRGWGLGLTFVKRIVEEYHRGRIFIKESAPRLGTTIQIVLPAHRGRDSCS